jgi:TPP-dependent pyruvate/acetoin dehydrogenase alpha subunit
MRRSFLDELVDFEKAIEARIDKIQCAVHLCLGQEAVPVVLNDHLRLGDWLFSTHRSHGHYLAKGGNAQALLDEIDGKPTGVNGGFSGSQSFCDPGLRFHSTAIVGGLIGAAAGAALACKLSKSDDLVVCCIGDGATEQGVFWEALNYSSLHSLPIVFVCENNGLSVHAPIEARQSSSLSARVSAFGVRYGLGVDWLDNVLAGRWPGPWFVEVPCERACNHVSAMEDLRSLPV